MKLCRYASVLCLLLMFVMPTAAQGETPLLAVANGMILRQAGEAVQPYTECQPSEPVISGLTVSPDRTRFVVATQPKIVTDVIEVQGGIGGGALPIDLWLCDMQNNLLRKIAEQPPNAVFMAGDVPDNITVRSYPAWSPDSSALVWTEMQRDGTSTMMLYRLTTDTIVQIPLTDVPVSYGIPAPPEPLWGSLGILFFSFGLDEITFENIETVQVYDKDGIFVGESELNRGGELSEFITERILVTANGTEYLGLLMSQSGWVLANPLTGEKQPMFGLPELYSVDAPDGLALLVQIDENYSFNWQLNGLEGKPTFENYPRTRIAISPDGTTVALGTGMIELWRAGSTTPMPGSDGFADDFRASIHWGTLRWRVKPGAVFATPAPIICKGAPIARLVVGGQGQVLPETGANNIRELPTTAAARLGQINAGETFTVLEGPVCADGYAWFRVQGATLTGWTAEGLGNTYWLAPVP